MNIMHRASRPTYQTFSIMAPGRPSMGRSFFLWAADDGYWADTKFRHQRGVEAKPGPVGPLPDEHYPQSLSSSATSTRLNSTQPTFTKNMA